jgi:glycoside hydrolase-like protein
MAALVLAGAGVLASAGAWADPGSQLRVVDYRGLRLTVPGSWPVYDLSHDPTVCVRFNRHAVYLGAPGPAERCPAQALGRTEAIVVQPAPGRATSARSGPAPSTMIPAAIGSGENSSGWWLDRRRGVLITATWVRHPELIRRALGVRSLALLRHPSRALPPGVTDAVAVTARSGSRHAASAPGAVYTGNGFDACSTPSPSTMSAWRSSYEAIGVYIGGVNEASCAGKGLTAGWVSRESAAGWHLIPIYVGLQAPSNECGCQGIASSSARREGRSAARDAVNQARSLGLGQGNPVYFDMESYSRSTRNTSAVLRFLAAWTGQLHAEGYLSGVYSGGDSGIVDLVSKVGRSYVEPDDLWIARWDGVRSTSDPSVPAGYWVNHERLHQNAGDHNETHGGVTVNVDGDYLDGSTAAAGTAAGIFSPPAATLPPVISGAPVQGQQLTVWHGSWLGVPTSYSEQWEDCDAFGSNCVPIRGATSPRYVVRASDLGHKIRVMEIAANADGSGLPVTSDATAQVLNSVPVYWLRNRYGNIYPSQGTPFYGSPRGSGFRAATVTGAAATANGRGYWEVTRAGRVFNFGDAAALPPVRHSGRIVGIVAAPDGGYWLYSAGGSVYPSQGAVSYGSPADSGPPSSSVTGMAATPDGLGYWLVTRAGRVFSFGDAAALPAVRHSGRIVGIVAAPGGGYWLYSAGGNVYATQGAKSYGAPAISGVPGSPITGMAATSDGQGYWLVDSAGDVFAYGDAARLPAVGHRHAITGIFR